MRSANPYGALSVAFSPDGRTLVAAADDIICVWDTVTGELKHSHHLPEHFAISFARYFAFSQDGRALAVAADDIVCLWDTVTGELKHTLRGKRFGDVMSLAFSPDGSALAVGRVVDEYGPKAGIVRLWDPVTGAHLRTRARWKGIRMMSIASRSAQMGIRLPAGATTARCCYGKSTRSLKTRKS